MKNYYEILNVAYDDPQGKIKARYRLLALTLHPDITGVHRTVEFTQYAEAYRILGNPITRQNYNETIGIFTKPRPLMPGTDLYQRITITPTQSENGAIIQLPFSRYEPCSLCWLSGCYRCEGQGMILEKVHVEVEVRSNTRNNAVILIENQGSTTEPGGSRGNLFIYVTVLE